MELKTSESAKERVWALHCRGLSVSEISRKLKISETDVKSVILGLWQDDNLSKA